jgi:Tfp pilus assembly protein PilF
MTLVCLRWSQLQSRIFFSILLENALEAIDARLSEDPHNLALYLERARILTQLDRDDDAKQAYLDLIGVDPTNFDALNELGALLSG